MEAGLAGITPLGRVAEPVDVARVVCFLASNDSYWVNGEVRNQSLRNLNMTDCALDPWHQRWCANVKVHTALHKVGKRWKQSHSTTSLLPIFIFSQYFLLALHYLLLSFLEDYAEHLRD